MNRFIDYIVDHYKGVILFFIIISIPALYFFSQQRFLNHLDVFFENDDPDLIFYKDFQKTYGNDDTGVIAFNDKDIFTKENIELIRKISIMAKQSAGIQRVYSITEQDMGRGEGNNVRFSKLIPQGELNPKEFAMVRKRILLNETVTGRLLSKDGTMTMIMMELLPVKDNIIKRNILMKIKKQAEEYAGGRVQLRFSGPPFVEVEMNRLSRTDFIIFSPVVFFMIFFVCAFILRDISLSVVCQFDLLVTCLLGIGVYSMMGERFNIVTVVIMPILLAVTVADSIHLLSHFKEYYLEKGGDKVEVTRVVAKYLWFPCLFTSLTSGFGFLSFITSTIRPVKIMGIYTFTGVMLDYVMTVTFLIAALMVSIMLERNADNYLIKHKGEASFFIKFLNLFKKAYTNARPDEVDRTIFTRLLLIVGKFTIKFYKPIFVMFIIITALAFWGIFMIRYETNFVKYLPDDSVIKKDIQFIEKNLAGTVPCVLLVATRKYEVVRQKLDNGNIRETDWDTRRVNTLEKNGKLIDSKKMDYDTWDEKKENHRIDDEIRKKKDFTNPESLNLIGDIEEHLIKEIKEFTTSFTIYDYFREINKAFHNNKHEYYKIPTDRNDIIDYYELADSKVVDSLISPDRNEARITIQSVFITNEHANKTAWKLGDFLRKKLGDDYTFKATGLSTLYLTMEYNLRQSQRQSFTIAFFIILFMMAFVGKNFKLTLLSMVPNVFPIVCTLGLMGWMDIPLDVSTIMIASVTLGIAVDDTIHFIVGLRRNIDPTLTLEESMLKNFRNVGKPIVMTSIVLFFGFFALILGSIKPTRAFGVLTAMAMMLALVGDLFVLPALILLFKPNVKFQKKNSH